MIKELKEIASNKDTITFKDNLHNLLNNLIKSDLASLYIYDQKKQALILKLFYNRKEDTLESIEENNRFISMLNPKGCIGKSFLTKATGIHNYITSDKNYIQEYDNKLNFKLKSQLIYPIIDDDELIGVLRLSTTINSTLKKYTSQEVSFIKSAEPYLIKIIKNIINENHIFLNDLPNEKTMNPTNNNEINDDEMLLFLSNTVHDIRTPANSLYGFLELLENQIEDNRLRSFITNAKESASFINTLTDSILEVAKSRHQSNLNNKEVILPIKFFSELVNTFSAKMLEKKIHYFIYISPDIPKEIKLDTLKLKRILINLIGNAYKFTPQKHQINIDILWNNLNKSIDFNIKDTGIGINENDKHKLFKSFSQATDETHNKYGGTGLGLAISAGYVHEMGGELKLNSSIDIGSEFYFNIPVEVVDATPSYEPFFNLDKKILILTDYIDAKYPKFIKEQIISLGMPEDRIYISNTIEGDVSHLICFEEKITSNIIESSKLNEFELLLIENNLFSLLKDNQFKSIKITSKNIYNADSIYSTIFSGRKLNVLIVDDNKINVTLLESMLAGEYLNISSSLDGESALKLLIDSSKGGNPFDIIYLDKHMDGMSGNEVLSKYRLFESKNSISPVSAISISGDPEIKDEDKELYNEFVHKPFNRKEILAVLNKKQIKED